MFFASVFYDTLRYAKKVSEPPPRYIMTLYFVGGRMSALARVSAAAAAEASVNGSACSAPGQVLTWAYGVICEA